MEVYTQQVLAGKPNLKVKNIPFSNMVMSLRALLEYSKWTEL